VEVVGKRITVMEERVMVMTVEVDGRTIIIEIRMEEEGTSIIIETSIGLITIIMEEMVLVAMKKLLHLVLVGEFQLVKHKEVIAMVVEVLGVLLLYRVDGETLTQLRLVTQQILTKKSHNQVAVGEILNLQQFQNQEEVEDGEDQNLLLILLVRYQEVDGVVLNLQLFKKQIMDGEILRLTMQHKIKEMAGIANKLSRRASKQQQQWHKEELGVDLRKHKEKMKIIGIILNHLQNLLKHLISVNQIMKIQLMSKIRITK
jgi:hypothetical protein